MSQERVPAHLKQTSQTEKTPAQRQVNDAASPPHALLQLQQQVGNQAVQRLVAQRAGGLEGAFDLDDATSERINRERGGGQALDQTAQRDLGQAMGADFSGVRVHSGEQSDQLNQQLGAKAFTTGQDVFFRSGAYQPSASEGQQLLAHELTHVVQQGAGRVQRSSGMSVTAAGDAYEQEADQVAQQAVSTMSAQREGAPEEEEPIQMQRDMAQREAAPEEEEPMQMQRADARSIQRQEMNDEMAE